VTPAGIVKVEAWKAAKQNEQSAAKQNEVQAAEQK